MPISLECSCGKQLRVSEEYAGRRVKCPDCGKGIAVPDDSTETEDDPGDAFIRFTCDCGKQLQVQAEYAGKMTRCPACGSKQEIPDQQEAGRREAKTRIRSEPPAPKKAAARREQEDEEDEEERDEPRKKGGRRAADEDGGVRTRKRGGKKQKRGFLPLILIGVAVLVLLGGGGFTGYWFFLRGGGGVSDLAYIPADAKGFVTVRLADLSKVDAFQKLVQAQGGDPLGQLSNELGLAAPEIERASTVFQEFEQTGTWAVLATVKPYDQKAILNKIQSPRVVKHEGKSFHVGQSVVTPPQRGGMPAMGFGPRPSGQRAVFFAGPKVLVMTDDEAAMKRVLTAAARKSVTGPLGDAIRQIGGSRHLYGAFILPASAQRQMKQGAQQLPPQAKIVLPLLEFTSGTVAMDFGDTHVVDLSLKFADDARAQAAKGAVDGMLGLAELFLLPMVQDKNANAAIKETLSNLKAEQRGTELVVNLRVKNQALEALKPPQAPVPVPRPRRPGK